MQESLGTFLKREALISLGLSVLLAAVVGGLGPTVTELAEGIKDSPLADFGHSMKSVADTFNVDIHVPYAVSGALMGAAASASYFVPSLIWWLGERALRK